MLISRQLPRSAAGAIEFFEPHSNISEQLHHTRPHKTTMAHTARNAKERAQRVDNGVPVLSRNLRATKGNEDVPSTFGIGTTTAVKAENGTFSLGEQYLADFESVEAESGKYTISNLESSVPSLMLSALRLPLLAIREAEIHPGLHHGPVVF